MRLVKPAHNYLIYRLIHRGGVGSKKSWATIGQHLYDYFGFLEANDIDWRDSLDGRLYSPVSAYRNWAVMNGNANSTVNQRLGTVIDFYKFAKSQGWISALPFSFDEVHVIQTAGFLSHISGQGQKRFRADVLLKHKNPSIKFLAPSQIRQLLGVLTNPTHRMMARMGLQIGLRREEIATFPLKYIFDPVARGRTEKQLRLDLKPGEISLKGNRPRQVYMSRELMRDLYFYSIQQRPILAAKSGKENSNLFLTDQGAAWAEDGRGFLKILAEHGKTLGFKVHPHMLRHTYATHTLHALMQGRDRIEPLVFLQRQLGHASISSTMIYLHLVQALAESATIAYDDEITSLSQELGNA